MNTFHFVNGNVKLLLDVSSKIMRTNNVYEESIKNKGKS